MKKVKLHDGYEMPIFGLGTFKASNGEEAYDTVKYALELGYRHIDTAQSYGNEQSVGDAIRDSKIDRKDIFITTKQSKHQTLENMEIAFNESLRKLQTDYVDLYLIHWPNHNPELNERSWKFFEKLYESGKAKTIGISNFQIHHIETLLKTAKVLPMVNQVETHPGLSQVPLKKYLDEKNIQHESYGPLMQGGVFKGRLGEGLGKIAEKYGKTIPQIVIAWGIKRGIVMIPKSTTLSHIKDNYDAQFIDLADEDVEAINDLNSGTRVYTDPDNSPWGALQNQ